MALEWSPEGGEGKSIAGRGNCRCKGPGVGVCTEHSQTSKEAPVCGVVNGNEAIKYKISRALCLGHGEDLGASRSKGKT